jgi:hypothetical protein
VDRSVVLICVHDRLGLIDDGYIGAARSRFCFMFGGTLDLIITAGVDSGIPHHSRS